MLGLVLTSVEKLTNEVKTGGNLGCSDHALIGLVILRNTGPGKEQSEALGFQRANFKLFKDLGAEIP